MSQVHHRDCSLTTLKRSIFHYQFGSVTASKLITQWKMAKSNSTHCNMAMTFCSKLTRALQLALSVPPSVFDSSCCASDSFLLIFQLARLDNVSDKPYSLTVVCTMIGMKQFGSLCFTLCFTTLVVQSQKILDA